MGTRHYAVRVRGKPLGRRVLGDRLRALRTAKGFSRGDAARAIKKRTEKIVGHFETGERLIPELELDVLAKFYECTDEEIAELEELRERASQPSEFASFGLPESTIRYLELERAASTIRTFQNLIIPDMLQVEPYMSRLFQLAHVEPSVIDSWVQARLKRQERLRPPHLAHPGASTPGERHRRTMDRHRSPRTAGSDADPQPARQLEAVLAEYVVHFNAHRPHRTLNQAAPLQPLPPPASPSQLHIRRRDRLGGLIHEYSQVA